MLRPLGLLDQVAPNFITEYFSEHLLYATYLVVLIKPEEGQICNANRLPVVLNLLACAVDYMSHLICHYKFEIL